MVSSFWRSVLISVMTMLLVFLFQNCSKKNVDFLKDKANKTATSVETIAPITSGVESGDSSSEMSSTEEVQHNNSFDNGSSSATPTGATSPIVNLSVPEIMVSDDHHSLGADITISVNNGQGNQTSYQCEGASGTIVSGTIIGVTGEIQMGQINEDLVCTVKSQLVGENSELISSSASTNVNINVNCLDLFKINGVCKPFVCEKFKTITKEDLKSIPARSADGICYSLKVMDAISFSPSSGPEDATIQSRNHGSNGGNRRPISLGSFHEEIKILGNRSIRLSGSKDSLSPILVDNFIVYGIIPSSMQVPLSTAAAYEKSNYYQSYYFAKGTADSTLIANEKPTDYIKLNSAQIKLSSFGKNGTSTIAALDLTSRAPVNEFFRLDLRALDCGGSKELSEIYLVFQ